MFKNVHIRPLLIFSPYIVRSEGSNVKGDKEGVWMSLFQEFLQSPVLFFSKTGTKIWIITLNDVRFLITFETS